MSTPIEVASFTIVLVRGAVYQKTFTIRDDSGVLVTLDSAQINVTPVDAASFSWTQANGKFTNASPGVYDLDLTAANTQSYSWSNATYQMAVVESSDANPCLIEGLVFVKNC